MPIRLTPAVKGLLISCFVVFLIQQTADQFIFHAPVVEGILALVPAAIAHGWFWQIFTYAFVHGDVMHIFFNLLMLAFIAPELEAIWGTRRFLTFYFFCSFAAGFLYLFLQLFMTGGLNTPMLGASGAIYGLLMAYGLIFGERTMLFMMLFPMKAKHFVWILAGIEFMTSIYSRAGLASAAHLGGMVAGLGYLWGKATWIVYRRNRQARVKTQSVKKRRDASHLRLVRGEKRSKGGGSDDDMDDKPTTWH